MTPMGSSAAGDLGRVADENKKRTQKDRQSQQTSPSRLLIY